jgi:hypothetical protein
MGYNQLKQRYRTERAHYPHHVALRVDRTLSWLHRAASFKNNLDGQFIILWVAFNGAYAKKLACLNVSEAATLWCGSDRQTSTHHY